MLGIDKKELKRQKGWRIDAALADYVEERGKTAGETNVIEGCIRLSRTLDEVLTPHAKRLEAYAAANGMTIRDHWSAVVARLVLEGLDAKKK